MAVSNDGLSDLSNVTLSDTLPAGTTFVSLTHTTGFSNFTCITPAVGAPGTISCSIASLPGVIQPGFNFAGFALVVHVNTNLAGSTLSNTAVVASVPADTNTSNNSATTTTQVTGQTDISVTKTDSPDPVLPNGNLTYTITFTNTGPGDAQNVTLTDNVPVGTTFVSFTAPAGWTTTTPPLGGTGAVTARNTFAAGSSAVFTLVVRA
jgi:uncharacterized repeat protein (TIGR01451 family)